MRFVQILFLSTLLMAFNSYAGCEYSVDAKDVEVKWTAFKTAKKVGVSGTFKKVKLDDNDDADSLEELVNEISFDIDGESVFSKNKGRDLKIAKFFFAAMAGGASLKGSFSNFKDDKMVMKLTLNERTKEIQMKTSTSVKNGQTILTGTGEMEMMDFALFSQHKTLGNACKVKHEGKMWTDVVMEFTAKIKKDC